MDVPEPIAPSCPRCAELSVLIEQLRREVAELKARLDRDSSNSSKPPSGDAPWKPRPRGRSRSGRKRGGQQGHEPHNREMLEPENCDAIVEHRPEVCTGCGADLSCVPAAGMTRHQQMELAPKPVLVTEHRALAVVCPCCARKNRGAIAPENSRLLGPRLAASAAVLAGHHHVGRRDVQEVLEDVLGAKVSLGALSEAEAFVAEALAKPCEAIREEVLSAPAANIDDTPFYEGAGENETLSLRPGARIVRMARKGLRNLWTLCTATATVFRIAASRSRAVVDELLAGFEGTITSDRLASYLHFDTARWQVCWAHLRRDFEAMATDASEGSKKLGDLLAMFAGEVFRAWDRFTRGEIDFAGLGGAVAPLREKVDVLLRHGPARHRAGDTARRTCENLLKLGDALWTFARVEGIEPTNNAAERELRRAVRWRKRSYGTMSERGSRFAERILTVAATIRKRGASVLDYVAQAITAHARNADPPPLPAAAR